MPMCHVTKLPNSSAVTLIPRNELCLYGYQQHCLLVIQTNDQGHFGQIRSQLYTHYNPTLHFPIFLHNPKISKKEKKKRNGQSTTRASISGFLRNLQRKLQNRPHMAENLQPNHSSPNSPSLLHLPRPL